MADHHAVAVTSQAPLRILISGIPGTGKSEFSRWLAREYNFLRCPSGEEPSETFLSDTRLALQEDRIVIDWGFPANEPSLSMSLDFIEEARDVSGLQPWWFDGDRAAALESFLRRATVPRSAWDKQLAGIESNWTRIAEVFKPRILKVITAGPEYLPNDERFHRMFPAGA